jgi:hypothetical protein
MVRVPPYTHQTVFVGMACSLLLHAAGVGVFAWVGTREAHASSSEAESQLLWPEEKPVTPPEVEPPAKLEPPPEPPSDMKLGIDRPDDVNAKAWKGFETATEHLAPESTVDQPALSTVPGNPGPPSPPAPASSQRPEVEPAESPTADQTAAPADSTDRQPLPAEPMEQPATDPQLEPQPEPQQPAEPQPDPQQPQEQQPLPVQPLPEQPEVQQPDMVGPPAPAELLLPPQQSEVAQPLEAQPNPQQPLPRQPLEPKDGSAGEPAEAGKPSTGSLAHPAKLTSPATSAIPGEKSDSESWASAVEGSLVYRPGHPLGTKGMQVTTVAPRWSVTTQIVAKPRNAVILIKFGRSGKVLQAEFVEGQTTGYAEVDGPLLDAVYRWTAKGKLLEKIPANDADAGLVFSIRFLFN